MNIKQTLYTLLVYKGIGAIVVSFLIIITLMLQIDNGVLKHIVAPILTMIIFIRSYSKKHELECFSMKLWKVGDLRSLISVFLIAFGYSIVNSEFLTGLLVIIPMNFEKDLINYIGTGGNALSFDIGARVIAPIAEEIFYRGILLVGLSKVYSEKKAIVISAMVFSIMHLNPWQVVGAFCIGLVLGWIYMRTKSLGLCMLLHGLINAMDLIVTKLIRLDIPGYTVSTPVFDLSRVSWDLAGICLLGLGIWLQKKVTEKYRV